MLNLRLPVELVAQVSGRRCKSVVFLTLLHFRPLTRATNFSGNLRFNIGDVGMATDTALCSMSSIVILDDTTSC